MTKKEKDILQKAITNEKIEFIGNVPKIFKDLIQETKSNKK